MARLALFWVMPFPWAFAALGQLKSMEAGEESLHWRRAFTSLTGGVSRYDRQTRYYSLSFQRASGRQRRERPQLERG
jgi:hypothetical protein